MNKTVLRNAEVGLERACHALRWKLHIERAKDARREQLQSPHEAHDLPEGGEHPTAGITQQREEPHINRTQDVRGTYEGQQQSLRKPQFPNVPTKQADPVDRDTEHAMGALKHRIMAEYTATHPERYQIHLQRRELHSMSLKVMPISQSNILISAKGWF